MKTREQLEKEADEAWEESKRTARELQSQPATLAEVLLFYIFLFVAAFISFCAILGLLDIRDAIFSK